MRDSASWGLSYDFLRQDAEVKAPKLSVGDGVLIGQELQAADLDLLKPLVGRLLVARVVHRERAREVCGRAVDDRDESVGRVPGRIDNPHCPGRDVARL